MKVRSGKVLELHIQLKRVLKDVELGKIDKAKAAEKIIEIREAIDQNK